MAKGIFLGGFLDANHWTTFEVFFKVFYQERIREKNLGKGIGMLAAIDFLPLRRKAFETKYIWLSVTDENR